MDTRPTTATTETQIQTRSLIEVLYLLNHNHSSDKNGGSGLSQHVYSNIEVCTNGNYELLQKRFECIHTILESLNLLKSGKEISSLSASLPSYFEWWVNNFLQMILHEISMKNPKRTSDEALERLHKELKDVKDSIKEVPEELANEVKNMLQQATLRLLSLPELTDLNMYLQSFNKLSATAIANIFTNESFMVLLNAISQASNTFDHTITLDIYGGKSRETLSFDPGKKCWYHLDYREQKCDPVIIEFVKLTDKLSEYLSLKDKPRGLFVRLLAKKDTLQNLKKLQEACIQALKPYHQKIQEQAELQNIIANALTIGTPDEITTVLSNKIIVSCMRRSFLAETNSRPNIFSSTLRQNQLLYDEKPFALQVIGKRYHEQELLAILDVLEANNINLNVTYHSNNAIHVLTTAATLDKNFTALEFERILQYLIKYHININQPNNIGETPLSGAKKNIKIVDVLLKNGADPWMPVDTWMPIAMITAVANEFFEWPKFANYRDYTDEETKKIHQERNDERRECLTLLRMMMAQDIDLNMLIQNTDGRNRVNATEMPFIEYLNKKITEARTGGDNSFTEEQLKELETMIEANLERNNTAAVPTSSSSAYSSNRTTTSNMGM